jgi:RNA polymerase sigma factor (sigma-70 family)
MDILLHPKDSWPTLADETAASAGESGACEVSTQSLKQMQQQKAANASDAALEKLYKAYFPSLYKYGLHLYQDEGMVEDCIQDLFVDLLDRKDSLAHVQSIRHYLFTSFRRRVLKRLALHRKQVFGEEWEKQGFEIVLPHDAFLVQSQITEEQRQKLEKALNLLSKKQREALYLKFYDGMTSQEIGDLMGLSNMAVYKLISRGLDLLKDNLPGFYLLLLFPSFL